MKKLLLAITIMITVQVYAQNLCLKAPQTYTASNETNTSCVRTADLDGNSQPDMVTASVSTGSVLTVSVFMNFNPSTNLFTSAYTYTVINASGSTSIAVADFDVDGKPDVMASIGSQSSLYFFKGTGLASNPLSAAIVLSQPVFSGIIQLEAAKMNSNDTLPDLVFITSYSVATMQNSSTAGSVSFNAYQTPNITGIAYLAAFVVGDFDGQNGNDIALAANYATNNFAYILSNTSSGVSFNSPVVQTISGASFNCLSTVDIDRSGNTDIALASSSGVIFPYTTNAGTFTPLTSYTTSGSNSIKTISSADFDLDGYQDLVVSTYYTGINAYVLKNTGSNTFNTAYSYSDGGGTYQYYLVSCVNDFNSDAVPDAAFAKVGGGGAIMLGQHISVNASPSFTVCSNNNSVSLIASGSSSMYSWTSIGTGAVINQTPTATTVYTVSSVVGTCTLTSTNTVVVDATPILTVNNSFICEGSMATLTAAGATTYTWNTGAIVNPLTVSPFASTNYTVSGTSSSGCVGTATAMVTVFPVPSTTVNQTNVTCNGLCNGTATVVASGGTGPYVYSWSQGETTPVASTLCAGSYSVSVSDANGCLAPISTVTIIQPFMLTLSTTPSNTAICVNNSTGIAVSSAGGTGTCVYSWIPSTSLSSSTGASVIATPPVTTVYTVTGTDANGCTALSTSSVTVNTVDRISGAIDTSGTLLSHGVWVYLYQHLTTQLNLAAYDSVQVLANGTYNFNNITTIGDYFVGAVPDTTVYTRGVTTYYSTTSSNSYIWDSSTYISIGCNNLTNNNITISILQTPPVNLSALGVINGSVTYDASYTPRRLTSGGNHSVMGAPLKGIGVSLGKIPGGACAARTTTDTAGKYTFTYVDTGNYIIYVDIPNYGMDSTYRVQISSTSTLSTGNNYIVDSTTIYIDTASMVGIKQHADNYLRFIVYPNPANSFVQIIFNAKLAGDVKIYDVLGNVVMETTGLKDKNNINQIDISMLPSGVYFVRIENAIQKFIKQ